MSEKTLNIGEIERIASDFIQKHTNVDTDRQKIENSRVVPKSGGDLGTCYEIEGQVKHVYKTDWDRFDLLGERSALKEFSYRLKISANTGQVLAYEFEDAKPNHTYHTTIETKPISDLLEQQVDTDLKRVIMENIEDSNRARKDKKPKKHS